MISFLKCSINMKLVNCTGEDEKHNIKVNEKRKTERWVSEFRREEEWN